MKSSPSSENTLLLAVRDVITELSAFNMQDKGIHYGEEFTHKMHRCFKQFVSQMKKNAISVFIQQQAQYAVAALIDEMIMYSNWPYKKKWHQQALQLLTFNDTKAGEHFFEKLQQFCCEPMQHKELIELYYVCLQLGFRGKYRGNEVPLQSLCEDLYQTIKSLYAAEYEEVIVAEKTTLHPKRRFITKQWKICVMMAVFLMACQTMGYSMALTTHYHKLTHAWRHRHEK